MTREQERTMNRSAIISAAVKLFLRDGIDKTTVAEIADEAQLSPCLYTDTLEPSSL